MNCSDCGFEIHNGEIKCRRCVAIFKSTYISINKSLNDYDSFVFCKFTLKSYLKNLRIIC